MRAPVWIDARDPLTLRGRLVALHGGAKGVRDDASTHSPEIIEMATACSAGIVRNHPFVDGNKRTGFVVGILLSELNGYRFAATEEIATQAFSNCRPGRSMKRAMRLSCEPTPNRNGHRSEVWTRPGSP